MSTFAGRLAWRTVVVAAAVAAACAIVAVGGAPVGATGPLDVATRLLAALPVILLACHLAGWAVSRLSQPPVVGEILAGVAIGPSLLGWLAPEVSGWLFPPQVTSAVNYLAQLGLVLFMFLVGFEVSLGRARHHRRTLIVIAQVNLAVPFLAGLGLGVLLHRVYAPGVPMLPFVLFIAVATAVTAFPVLARILTDRRMLDTPTGTIAMFCAAVGDVVAWCMLAAVVALTRDQSFAALGTTVALFAVFLGVMVLAVRPAARFLLRESGPGAVPATAVLPLLLGGVLLASLATSWIGVHQIFGAFIFGVLLPRGVPRIAEAAEQIRGITVALLLPLFLAYAGLHTDLRLIGLGGTGLLWCLVVLLVAVTAKFGGVLVAARASGTGWRDSVALGALMNCRGLTELVVLDVGRQIGVLDGTLFAIFVIMTLVSTVMTGVVLDLVRRGRPVADSQGAVTATAARPSHT